jgi:ABC-type transport system involved in multi-copper enzyme maturation permease subunit
MLLLPVIERELRAAARQPFTYHLRVLVVLALFGVFAFFGLQGKTGAGIGGELFGAFHGALFCAIWALVPIGTADCISRERREGTLPLLFLTPLRPLEMVWAKGLVHGLRALTLWLAALPVLAISFVAGGVGWLDIALSILVNFSSICLALAAGLAASSVCRRWTRALGLSVALAGFLLFTLAWAFAWTTLALLSGAGVGIFPPGVGIFMHDTDWEMNFAMLLDSGNLWQQLTVFGSGRIRPVVLAFMLVSLGSFLVLALLLRFSAWRVKQDQQKLPPSPEVERLKEQLFRPRFFEGVLRRWLRWELRRNPIGWLERRSWSGRLVLWSWFAIVACIYSSLFANLNLYQRAFHFVQSVLATLLAGSIAVSAAASFRRERESGVLELLLVTPLREWQIIGGRVRGLWSQFAPAVLLLCGVWLYGASFLTDRSELNAVVLYTITFVTLPVTGLYFSLSKANFIAALVWTLGVQIIAPAVLERAARAFAGPWALAGTPGDWYWLAVFVPCSCQVLVAAILGWQMYLNLRRRRFVLQGG